MRALDLTNLSGAESTQASVLHRQLQYFVQNQISTFSPDITIAVERKGTAIMRALKEKKPNILEWPAWSQIVSSHALENLPRDYFDSKKILIFDDMMHTGFHVKEILSVLTEKFGVRIDDNTVRVAVFAEHEKCPKIFLADGTAVSTSRFCHSLSTKDYRIVRDNIVAFLQQQGSLLLDTEHIEIRLRHEGSINGLLTALGRTGRTVVFHSGGNRRNITVFYDDDDRHDLPRGLLPTDSETTGIVKKCRFVERAPHTYAIIPICYPAIPFCENPLTDQHWPSDPAAASILGEFDHESPKGRFYATGLLAALEVLGWVIRDLSAGLISENSLQLPLVEANHPESDNYDLEHLLSMYPGLNIEALTKKVFDIQRAEWKNGAERRSINFRPNLPLMVSDDELQHDALHLLQLIRYRIDSRLAEMSRDGHDHESHHPFGLLTSEIFKMARELGIKEDVRISSLFDILIDGAALVTHSEMRIDSKGQNKMYRTFEPDGEVISDQIRKYTMQWGLPRVR